VGLHQCSDAQHFDRCMISVNRLRRRKSDFAVKDWICDSGAFTELFRFGHYRHSVQEYADCIKRWKNCGNLLAAVSQDLMCEQVILEKTRLTTADHQRLTIERYDELLGCATGVYIMPVLQGYLPEEYVGHIRQYGDRLTDGMWVGVGSVCKRNSKPEQIEAILKAIHRERPDLRTHGFGLKITALGNKFVRELLWSADSMAWSFAARWQGRNANDWREAQAFVEKLERQIWQVSVID
jgi:hypothetical protein